MFVIYNPTFRGNSHSELVISSAACQYQTVSDKSLVIDEPVRTDISDLPELSTYCHHPVHDAHNLRSRMRTTFSYSRTPLNPGPYPRVDSPGYGLCGFMGSEV